MSRKTLVTIGAVIAILLFSLTFVGGVVLGEIVQQHKDQRFVLSQPATAKIDEVMRVIDHAYVDRVSEKTMVDGAVKGIIESLDDPFTHYLDAKYFKSFKEETSGHFDGVGIVVSAKNGELVVVSPIDGTPASKAGIKANDVIIKINNKPTKGMDTDKAVDMIRGKAGTKVTLAIRREGVKDPLTFELTREQINIPNVVSKKLDGNIGYARVHEFNERTSTDLKEQYDNLKAQGIKGFILDLRDNPGGLLDEAVNVGSIWIEKGPIIKIKDRYGSIETRDANGGADTKMPLVVLINKGSASASEIVSGALQDYGRAVIIGETSFGKASVQTVINLSDGSGLLLTTDKYLTPKGRMIHKKGIKPDIVVKFDDKAIAHGQDNQLDKAKEIIRELISGKYELKAAS